MNAHIIREDDDGYFIDVVRDNEVEFSFSFNSYTHMLRAYDIAIWTAEKLDRALNKKRRRTNVPPMPNSPYYNSLWFWA